MVHGSREERVERNAVLTEITPLDILDPALGHQILPGCSPRSGGRWVEEFTEVTPDHFVTGVAKEGNPAVRDIRYAPLGVQSFERRRRTDEVGAVPGLAFPKR